MQCKNLKNLNIPSSVKSIGDYAFRYCANLTNITIPKNVATIGATAFSDCPQLTISCYKASTAHKYAVSNKIKYTLIDAPTAPSAPQNFAATVKSPTNVLVTWNAATGAQGYEVWRKIGSGKDALVKTLSSSVRSYSDVNLIPGTSYSYKVRAYATINGKKTYGVWSPIKTVKPTVATPTNFKASVKTPTCNTMSWNAVSGAHGYEVYRSVNGGKYTFLRTIPSSTRSFSNTSLTPNTNYSYKVRAYVTVGKTKYYSSWTTANKLYPRKWTTVSERIS